MRILGKQALRLLRNEDVKKAVQELGTSGKESTQGERTDKITTKDDGKTITIRRVTIAK